MTVFVDTGVLFAATHAADRSHARARSILGGVGHATTTDHVLVECFTLLDRKVNRHAAVRFLQALRTAPLHVERVGEADFERALSIVERWDDQRFSLVDATSFAVMERIGCGRAASFDTDFAIYRYGPDGSRAFEILR